MEYTYSIIIPHKNCFTLLQRLLESIPKRNDLEVIVVDDNSDFTNIDLQTIIKNYPFVKFVNTSEGKGAGYARNIGLSIANGKWILFADSDDTFVTENLNHVMDEYKNINCDIIFFDANCIDEETAQTLPNLNKQYKKFLYSYKNKEEKCKFNIRVPWGKFIRKELINKYQIRFEETPVANDIIFSTKVGIYAKEVIINNYPIYNWMVQKKSITTNKSSAALMIHFMAGVRRNQILEQNKIYKYRSNLFCSIATLHIKMEKSWSEAIKLVLKFTPNRFIIKDFFTAIYFYFKELIYRL